MWGVLEVVAGAVAVVGALLAGPGAHGASVAVTTGSALALFGAIAILVPWSRIPARATLVATGSTGLRSASRTLAFRVVR